MSRRLLAPEARCEGDQPGWLEHSPDKTGVRGSEPLCPITDWWRPRHSKSAERRPDTPQSRVSFDARSRELLKNNQVVGVTDRVYSIVGPNVKFDDVLVKGDLHGELEYNGIKLRVIRIDTAIGLEVGSGGARGPVWKGVECEVLD